jgi:hypothetical protein
MVNAALILNIVKCLDAKNSCPINEGKSAHLVRADLDLGSKSDPTGEKAKTAVHDKMLVGFPKIRGAVQKRKPGRKGGATPQSSTPRATE